MPVGVEFDAREELQIRARRLLRQVAIRHRVTASRHGLPHPPLHAILGLRRSLPVGVKEPRRERERVHRVRCRLPCTGRLWQREQNYPKFAEKLRSSPKLAKLGEALSRFALSLREFGQMLAKPAQISVPWATV